MKTIETIQLGARSYAVVLPGVILAFDPGDDADFKLSRQISSHPGMPVVILCTKYDPAVFSQAETTNRTFVFSAADIPVAEVPAGAPVSWVSPGDLLPALPGDVSVTAVGSGFMVEKFGSHIKVFFSPEAADAQPITDTVAVAIVPPGTIISAAERYNI